MESQMSIPYMNWLRQYVGHQKIILPGAAGLVRDEQGRILLQKRRDVGLWGFPGGGQELGESILDTLRREVLEEVGLVVEPRRLIGLYTSPTPRVMFPNGDEVQPFVCLFECQAIGGALALNAEESLELGWFDLDNLPELTPIAAAVIRELAAFNGEPFII